MSITRVEADRSTNRPGARRGAIGLSLWARARAGDAGARQALEQLVVRVAASRVRAAEVAAGDVEDLCREAVASTLAYLEGSTDDDVRHLHAFVGWRVRAVLKRHWATQRHRAREVRLDREGSDDAWVDRRPRPEALARLREAAGLVRACIAELGRDDAELLRLRYVEGLAPVEIARLRSMRGSGVRVRIHRAMRRVRRRLRERGLGESCLA